MSERLAFNYGTRATPLPSDPRVGRPARAGAAPAPSERADLAYLGLLAFTAVLFFRPQDHFPPLRALSLAEWTAMIGLGAMFFQRLSRGLPIVRLTPELAGVLALGGVIAATIPFSIWPGGALEVLTGSYLKVALVFMLALHTVTTPKRLREFTWLMIIAAGYLGARAVLDYSRGINLIEAGRVTGAVGGIFRNPNDLALNLVAFMPIALFMFLRRGRPAGRYLALGLGVAMLAAIICTHSRAGMLGLGAALLFMALRGLRLRPGTVVAGSLILLLAHPLVPGSYWFRMQSIFVEELDETGSREARQALRREATEAFLERPLTGVGAGQFRNYRPDERREPWRAVHNVFLEFAADVGILGVTIFSFLVGRGFWTVRRARRRLEAMETPGRGRGREPPGRLRPVAVPEQTLSAADRDYLRVHTSAMSASLVGWLFCAWFAPVAYTWTFYYLLVLAVVPHELLQGLGRTRRPAAGAARRARREPEVI